MSQPIDVAYKFAAHVLHRWQHPTFTFGEERCSCPFVPEIIDREGLDEVFAALVSGWEDEEDAA